MYETLKDFQTLISALVAFAAALIAFISAQKATKVQAEASRDAVRTKHLLDVSARREIEAREQRAFALMLDQFLAAAGHRISVNLASFRDIRRIEANPQSRYTGSENAKIDLLELAMSRLKKELPEDELLSVDWKDLAAFDPTLMGVFHQVRRWMDRSRTLQESLMTALRDGSLGSDIAREHLIALDNAKVQPIRDNLKRFVALP